MHPQYLSVDRLEYKIPKAFLDEFNAEKQQLNDLDLVDYEAVIVGKWKYIRAVFNENKEKILKNRGFKKFIKENESWLLPYAAFCVQRDKYKTPNFNDWKTHKKFIAGKVAAFFSPKNKDFELHAESNNDNETSNIFLLNIIFLVLIIIWPLLCSI